MDSITQIMSAAVLVLVLLLVAVLVVQRRQRRAWKAQRLQDAMLHGEHLAGTAAAHAAQLSEMRRAQAASDAMRDSALHLAARGMRWELNSREALVRACDSAMLDAVIATNVVFSVPSQGRSFCAQIDHVVLTDSMMLIVDSKYWKGLVFDGTRPSELAEPLGSLVDETRLESPFAVQLRARNESSVDVRIDAGRDAPARQVRVGASRLHAHLTPLLEKVPFIDTCVFYSHPESTVFTPGADIQGKTRTLIADQHTIEFVVRRANAARPALSHHDRVEPIAAVLEALGADIVRTGRRAAAAQERPSPIALDYRVRSRRERAVMRTAT